MKFAPHEDKWYITPPQQWDGSSTNDDVTFGECTYQNEKLSLFDNQIPKVKIENVNTANTMPTVETWATCTVCMGNGSGGTNSPVMVVAGGPVTKAAVHVLDLCMCCKCDDEV